MGGGRCFHSLAVDSLLLDPFLLPGPASCTVQASCTSSNECLFVLPHPCMSPFSLQLTFLLDDVGIPKSYRFMPGFGVHTFRLLNKAGKETFVKFHWIPKQGEGEVRSRVRGGSLNPEAE